jgi:hypothetical protein
VLDVASHFGSDIDKENTYRKLIETNGITEEQWINLINKTQQISSELDRSNLLIQIASKIPKTENTKAAHLNAARTIHADADYTKVIKAIE